MLPAIAVSGLRSDKNKASIHNVKRTDSQVLHNSKKEKSTISKVQTNRRDGPTNFLNSANFCAVLIFLIGTLSGVLFTEFLPLKNVDPISNATQILNATTEINETAVSNTTINRPTFAICTARKDQRNLSVIRKILGLLGYTEVGVQDDWNLLWGFETPFISPSVLPLLTNLKPHQIVNHMPGMGFIVSKADLSTSGSPFMPPAFRLPKEKDKFLFYAAKHPEKIFVEKNNGHRNVAIKKPRDINLDSNSTFVQEFITNPYLVDGYKFDIGIYTVITSMDPLRLYIYTGDVMFRYCQKKFHPFDPKVIEKYVVGNAYRPTWKVPSLTKYFNRLGGGMRASFDAFVRDQGQNPAKIWEQAEEVIRHTVLSKAGLIAKKFDKYKRPNFFELIRVDLIVDTDLKIHLIEANLSPNMQSDQFEFNYIVFEQALYNALQLVGVGSPIKEQQNVTRFGERLIAVTADRNLASNLNECIQHNCDKTCADDECSLCIPCLSDSDYDILAKAHQEHIHRADMKRLFPKPIVNVNEFDLEEATKNYSERNKWMTKWYYHKCLYDRSWCQ